MEKLHVKVQTQSQFQEANNKKQQQQEEGLAVWDCGSTLYDSFELNSFKRQLDSAIGSSRTLSMPHLPDRKAPPPPPAAAPVPAQAPPEPTTLAKKSSSKISRSLQKLLKSVFKSKGSSSSSTFWLNLRHRSNDEYCVYYDKAGALTAIPEVPEIDFGGGMSPEINSLTRRTKSERFTAPTTIAISCA